MERVYKILCAPGTLKAVSGIAATSSSMKDSTAIHRNSEGPVDDLSEATTACNDEEAALTDPRTARQRLLDRWLDKVVSAAGSTVSFSIILIALLVWVFLGVPYGTSDNWQIIISDVQAVFCYIYDSLLMRQTFNIYRNHIRVAATLQSRNLSLSRMIHRIASDEKYIERVKEALPELSKPITVDRSHRVTWVGRTCDMVAHCVGHWSASLIFWLGIVAWLSCGPYMLWSNRWQLYMNSATSALLLFIFGFVANIGERFDKYTKYILRDLHELDTQLETKLRLLTGDRIPNAIITIAPTKVGKIQRAVFYYADLVGTLTGLAILVGVIIVWVCVGPTLQFNSNWWLIIGTYAGLIGMHDAVVLRNIHHQLADIEDGAFQTVHNQDHALLTLLDPTSSATHSASRPGLSQRISMWLSEVCAHTWMVIVVALTVVILVVLATIMKWSITGQLICNVPPSILESSLMMILVIGHNVSDGYQIEQLEKILARRVRLGKWADAVDKPHEEVFDKSTAQSEMVSSVVIVSKKA